MENNKIRTFGRIKSRKLKDSRAKKIEDILPEFEVKINGDAVENFPDTSNKIYFEIGFGYGEHAAHQAVLDKNVSIVACETYLNGVLSLLDKIGENNIKNIKIFNRDARELLEKIPDSSLDKIFILFPDPWPKKKQNKRRIINTEFLKLAKLKLKKGGVLFFASDILDYVEWTINYADDLFKPSFNSLEECAKEPDWWIRTRYQKKAIEAGRKCYFLEFLNF